jgi:thiamine biosynthesis lipoprotein
MGTVAAVYFGAEVAAERADRLAAEVFDWFDEVDGRFSTYRADSEVSRLADGRLAGERSQQLSAVLDACAALWRETDGYFDPHAGGRLDPSGYVKGWSIQVASQLLTAAGAINHLVEVGGDLQARGRPAPGEQWRIGLRHPFVAGAVFWTMGTADVAVATSGSYERGHHVINPRTGQPATELASVTLVGQNIERTDALATAVLAMPERVALAWLDQSREFTGAIITADGRLVYSAGLPGSPAPVGQAGDGPPNSTSIRVPPPGTAPM